MITQGRYIIVENINTNQWCLFDTIKKRTLTLYEIKKLEVEFHKHLDSINTLIS